MFRRPLVIMGLISVCISLILVNFFYDSFYPDSVYKSNEKVSFTCRITGIEEKEYSYLLSVKAGRYRHLIRASKSSIDISGIKTGNAVNAECLYLSWNEARNKGNFDEKSYYRSLGFYQKFSLKDFRITDSSYFVIPELMRSFRQKLEQSIEQCTDSETEGFIKAMVTGSGTDLDEDTKDMFRMSGIAHIFAVSGLHISIVGMGLFRIMRKRFRLPVAALTALLSVILYSVMCGMKASALRACIMMAVNIGAICLGRKYDTISSMCLAGIILLASDPFYIENSAFQLSFSAVMSVSVFKDPAFCFFRNAFAGDDDSSRRKKRFYDKFPEPLITSGIITLFTLPVIISMYYEFPLYSPVINIIVLSVMPYIFAGVLAGGIIGIVFPAAGRFIISAPVLLTKGITYVCRSVAYLPGNMICTGNRSFLNIIIYYMFFIAAAIILNVYNIKSEKHRKDHKSIFSLRVLSRSVVLALIALLLIFIISFKTGNTNLQISFIDVDQGECILIMSDSGNVQIIDAGSSSVDEVYKYRIRDTLKYYGISRIDNVIITHTDTDHISGILEMISDKTGTITVKNLMVPDFSGDANYDKITALAHENNINVIDIYNGLQIKDGALKMKCIHPGSDDHYEDVNDSSAVIALSYGDFTALITGDISSAVELELIKDGKCPKDIDLLDAAHHGSKNSNCEKFIDHLSPKVTVISAGVDNVYGHPHSETIQTLESSGSEIFCTSWHGQIDVIADLDGNMNIKTYIESTE